MKSNPFVTIVALLAISSVGCGGGKVVERDEYFYLGGFEAVVTVQGKRQAAIRDCMKRSGFDYLPTERRQLPLGKSGELDESKFASELGFGLFTSVDPDNPLQTDIFEVDPNQQKLLVMGKQERDAYYAALFGKDERSRKAACFETSAADEMTLVNSVLEKHYSAEKKMRSTPAWAALDREWSDCISQAGLGRFRSWDELYAQTEKSMDDFLKTFAPEVPDGRRFDPLLIDRNKLSFLQQEERDTASKSAQCDRPLEKRRAAIRSDAMSAFVNNNKSDLESYRKLWAP